MENEKIIDVTGVELTPGNMEECLGNGRHFDSDGNPIECCCDECDYFLLCFPEYDVFHREETTAANKDTE